MNKKVIQHPAIQTTILVSITFVFLLVLSVLPTLKTDWLDAEKMLREHVQFSDLYFRFHSHRDISGEEPHVIIVDISHYQSREELTCLFNQLADAQPFMVAMDVIFGNTAIPDTVVNNRLVESIRRLPNLVLATEMCGSDEALELRHSFFIHELQATEALANLPKSIIRTWKASEQIGDSLYPTFAAVIAQKMGMFISEGKREWLIDYSIQDTVVLRPHLHPLNPDFLRNQVIIVGDLEDLRDTRIVPLTFHADTRTTGVRVHKQIVQTIRAQRWFKRVPKVWEWIITYIFLWLIMFTETVLTPKIEKRTKWTQKRIKNINKFSILCLLVLVCYCLFWWTSWYLNPIDTILAIAMIWFGQWAVDLYKNRKSVRK